MDLPRRVLALAEVLSMIFWRVCPFRPITIPLLLWRDTWRFARTYVFRSRMENSSICTAVVEAMSMGRTLNSCVLTSSDTRKRSEWRVLHQGGNSCLLGGSCSRTLLRSSGTRRALGPQAGQTSAKSPYLEACDVSA